MVLYDDHYKGYGDGTIYGDPIEGSLESIKELYELGYTAKNIQLQELF